MTADAQNPFEILTMPGHLIRRLHQVCQSVFAAQMSQAGYDITSVQYGALAALEQYGELDQATLAGAIAYDRVTIGSVIDRLERKGWVTRRTSTSDRRARLVSLSASGKTLLADLRSTVDDVQTMMLPGLEEAERETLVDLLVKVTQAGNPLSRAPLRLPQ
jgi:MarR family transcriptional regulator, temperature-dependent positive regulator of motility